MRAALCRLVGTVLIVLGAFAAGVGAFAVSWALWPLLILWWPWLLAGMTAVVALGAWWLWWRLPKRQMRSITAADPKARADIEDNFRKTIGQLLGGAAVLIGAGFAYLQFTQQQRTRSKSKVRLRPPKPFQARALPLRLLDLRGLGDAVAVGKAGITAKPFNQPIDIAFVATRSRFAATAARLVERVQSPLCFLRDSALLENPA